MTWAAAAAAAAKPAIGKCIEVDVVVGVGRRIVALERTAAGAQ